MESSPEVAIPVSGFPLTIEGRGSCYFWSESNKTIALHKFEDTRLARLYGECDLVLDPKLTA